jgi:hypothetical protein
MELELDKKEEISRFNLRILVYTKKIKMHEKRRVYSRKLQALNSIEEDSIKSIESTKVEEHQVAAKEMKEFCGPKEMMKVVVLT